MNTKAKSENRLTMQPGNLAVTGVAALLLLVPVVAWSGGVVTSCTEANLRAAMVGGGTVTFACDGTITLASTITIAMDTVLDGTGHQIIISGGDAVRVFYLQTNVTFTAVNLTIANGKASSLNGTLTPGGGVFNDGGILNLLGVEFRTNTTMGWHWQGGAIFNSFGRVNATNSSFLGNVATSIPVFPYPMSEGGAIYNEGGLVNLQDCTFVGNGSRGVDGPANGSYTGFPGGGCGGGAIYNAGTLIANRCTFLQNFAKGGSASPARFEPSASGYPGAMGGAGSGGVIYNLGDLTLQSCVVASNEAIGGNGSTGGAGGTIPHVGLSGGNGGNGSSGSGSAIFNLGTAAVINCTLASNSSTGGRGGAGGAGGSSLYGGAGGAGGNGGSGLGVIHNTNNLFMTNCTLAFNSSSIGSGGAGGAAGQGEGGQSGPPGTSGTAVGGLKTNGGRLVNTLLATNAPGGNCSGPITDDGHNVSSDSSCAFTSVGSLNNTDPLLGPLANNGGPTLTMALLPGSPAIDAAETAVAPAIDQRGFPRPAGLAADIGAFEFGSMLPILSITRSGTNGVEILVWGNANQWCRLLTSTTLSDWQCVATNQIGPNGTVLFQDNHSAGETQRFYKVALP
jgi:hypothetical protein